MSVLTYKEISNCKEKSLKSLYKKNIKGVILDEVENSISKELLPKFLYVLIHPENEVSYNHNFEDLVIIEGNDYKRKCINGVVKTKEKLLKNYLINQGYFLIETIKEGDKRYE